MKDQKNSFKERYDKLNEQQKKAVDTIDGPLLVVAGPGSGKTEILSLRVAKILIKTQVLPSNILCMTFTDAASSNMRERLSKLIGNEAYRVSIHTFHSFCVNIIQKYPEYFYKGTQFTSADSLTQVRILEDIFKNLPQGNLFRDSFHEEKGFSYLSDAKKRIEHLKKSGITPDEFRQIIAHNKRSVRRAEKIIVPALEGRLAKNAHEIVGDVVGALIKAAELENKEDPFPQENSIFLPVLASYATSLQSALVDAHVAEGNAPISAWKSKYIKTRDDGTKTLKETLDEEKMDVLADVYDLYRKKMTSKAFYDFDDMILDAIEAIEKHPRLRFELQEQYQYILVDEFQDTNNAQMKLVNLILNAPVNEGRPNVMVVGDDDQAVYKFQGAELSNILNFKRMFTDVEIVTMTDNYRSTQDILDVATHIIRKGTGRLEDLFPEMEKSLKSLNKELGKGAIIHKKFETVLHESHFVSRKIKELIEAGTNPEDIAVIARKHERLESIVPYLKNMGVPIRYQREQNVFLEPHIAQLITISRFVESLSRKDKIEADNYLPQILSFPFWQLGRQTVWKISKIAYEERKPWLGVMLEYKDDNPKAVHKVSDIAHFLIDVAQISNYEPLEKVLDIIIGAHVVLAAESEDDEEGAEAEIVAGAEIENNDAEFSRQNSKIDGNTVNFGIEAEKSPAHANARIASPFKDFYFNQEKFEHSRTEYLSFLSSLRVFIRALRDYVGERALNADTEGTAETSSHYLTIEDLITFVELRDKNSLPLNDESPFASGEKAVNLLSAHGAKGLEFDTVFVLSCQDSVWAGRGMSNKISFPINLPIQPAGDDETDQMRLFYVALTRAKKHLYLTSYKIAETGKESSILRFMLPQGDFIAEKSPAILHTLYNPEDEGIDDGGPETHELLTASWLSYNTPPFFGEEIELLKILLKDYKLSVTHLNNFLNVTRGGPQTFLEQNLLRFPQAKTLSSSYGSAIHKAIERLIVSKKMGGDYGRDEEEEDDTSGGDAEAGEATVSDAGTATADGAGEQTEKEKLIKWFIMALKKERMSNRDFEYHAQKGTEALSAFYEQKKSDFSGDDLSEVDFKNEGVLISDTQGRTAHLTGKIDKIFKNENREYEVVDFKTGKAELSWNTSLPDKKIKLNDYRRQLFFYKLLMENSARYKGSTVSRGLLQFVEPIKEKTEKGTVKDKIIGLDLDLKNINVGDYAEGYAMAADEGGFDEHDRLKRLACIVYEKIMNLDFPDVKDYDPSLKGIREFEDWLLAGN